MESYRQLSEVDGMSSLIAFCLNSEAGEIQAAFQYDTHSLQEAMEVAFARLRTSCSHKTDRNCTSSSAGDCSQ